MAHLWFRRVIALPWGRMNAYVAGDGAPLLLLHGLGGSGRYWAGLQPHLDDRMLIAPDLAGFGRSDKPAADYSRAFHLDALDGVLGGLGVSGSFDVAGHSMGGVLAALVAARHPQRVEALALVASPFPRTQEQRPQLPNGVSSRALYAFVQRTLPLVSPLVRSRTYPRAVIADYLRHTPDSYRRTSRSLIWDPGIVEELAPLRAATSIDQLLLYSEEDATIAADSLAAWRTVLPRAEVRTAPGGHQLLLRGGFAELAAWLRRPAGVTPG